MEADDVTKRRCAKHVFSGERWDVRGHGCGKPGTVNAGGKWWCKQHSPEGEAAKKAKDAAKYAAQRATSDARWAREHARDAALEFLLEMVAATDAAGVPDDATTARAREIVAALTLKRTDAKPSEKEV